MKRFSLIALLLLAPMCVGWYEPLSSGADLIWDAASTKFSFLVSGSSVVDVDNNGDLLPATDGSSDLGGAAKEWEDLHVDGTAYIDAAEIGAITAEGSIIPATTEQDSLGSGTKAWLYGYIKWSRNTIYQQNAASGADLIFRTRDDSQDFSFQASGGGEVAWIDSTGHLGIKIYNQNDEPDIPNNSCAFWVDADGGPAYYLILDVGGTQVKATMS